MATDTRQRMIDTTARLVQERGFHGVSLGDILRESGAPRGSLYFHFPGGKKELVLEAMREGIEEASRILRECMAGSGGPAEGIRTFFVAAAEEMGGSDYTFGCPVAPVVLDTTDSTSELASVCRSAFDEWRQIYRDSLIAAGLDSARAARLAVTVLASLEGALILARSQRDADCIRQIGEDVAAMVKGALAD